MSVSEPVGVWCVSRGCVVGYCTALETALNMLGFIGGGVCGSVCANVCWVSVSVGVFVFPMFAIGGWMIDRLIKIFIKPTHPTHQSPTDAPTMSYLMCTRLPIHRPTNQLALVDLCVFSLTAVSASVSQRTEYLEIFWDILRHVKCRGTAWQPMWLSQSHRHPPPPPHCTRCPSS